MKRFVLGPLLAALAMFFWGFLYWGAPHAIPYKATHTVPDDAAAMEALQKAFPVSGYYLLPSPLKGSAQMQEGAKRGLAQVNIIKESLPAMDPKAMALGFLHCYLVALFLTVLLTRLAPSFQCTSCRVRFAAMIGLLLALYDFGQAIWWKHPIGWVSVAAFYNFTEFVIAGLVLAKFVTPKVNPTPAPPA
jgi:hypothetical protein